MARYKKGLMGIGTLIIFIAVILVAAVAAMVIITTSGTLQSRSLTTGKQTEEGVSTGAEVVQVYGENANDSYLDSIEITLRLRAGSSPIKLSTTALTQDTQHVYQHMTYAGTDTAANTTHFNVSYINTGPNNLVGYLGEGDVVKVAYDIIKSGGQANGLGEEEDVVIHVIPRRGQATFISFITPSTLRKIRERLYP